MDFLVYCSDFGVAFRLGLGLNMLGVASVTSQDSRDSRKHLFPHSQAVFAFHFPPYSLTPQPNTLRS